MNSFGRAFSITIFGESHSPELGVSIKGVPAGIPLSPEDFASDLKRRSAGARGTTPRKESDSPQIVRGVKNGLTTSEELLILFQNNNIRPADYDRFKAIPRPGHADFVAQRLFEGKEVPTGGGQFSGRMTLPIVAAGVVAKKIVTPIQISARLSQVAGIDIIGNPDDNPKFQEALDGAIKEGDSLGGVVECVCNNVPIGLGEPFFDSLESNLSHLVFSIPGVRGIEFGDGFAASRMKGSQHNDSIIDSEGHTSKNGAGGINGGISNGNPILFRVAIKPTSSISKPQVSFNMVSGKMEEFSISGRHDVCFALRTPVIFEAVAAIVLCDNLLIW